MVLLKRFCGPRWVNIKNNLCARSIDQQNVNILFLNAIEILSTVSKPVLSFSCAEFPFWAVVYAGTGMENLCTMYRPMVQSVGFDALIVVGSYCLNDLQQE
uniref:Ovule protein n=1 Tax=Ascaris lumbricoides TaxID=6252 RepID=A0A0M3HXD6_ASCLU